MRPFRSDRVGGVKGIAIVVSLLLAALAVPVLWFSASDVDRHRGPVRLEGGPQQRLPDDAKRYMVIYDNRDAVNRLQKAVEECRAIPGVSKVRRPNSPPLGLTVIVTGTAANRSFQACVGPLDGVTVTPVGIRG